MALNLANLGLVSGPNGIKSIAAGALGVGAPKVWTYITEDTQATMDTAGYFNAGVAYAGAYHMMDPGDIIFVVKPASGAIPTGTGVLGILLVKDKSSGTLDVANAIDVGGTIADGD